MNRDLWSPGGILLILLALLSGSLAVWASPDSPTTPEARALAYLAAEVPRWSAENHCYSCHNNGDAARALYTAKRLGRNVPASALADTTRWLSRPEAWDHNGGEGPFSDKHLARLQFAATLAAAVEAGVVTDPGPLERAADGLAREQSDDGSWRIGRVDGVGSPATYGPVLATALARRTLVSAGRTRHAEALSRAERWLWGREVKTVLDASALMIALEKDDATQRRPLRERCLKVLREGQSEDGGWGPYTSSPSETFDTALAVLALSAQTDRDGVAPLLRRGRDFLIATQAPDGSWPETTRPPGATSYAQRLSTTGWATMALLFSAER
jgi:hypothetical protein